MVYNGKTLKCVIRKKNELKEGDMIVLDGLTKVYDGAEVIINSKTEPSGT